MNVGELIDLLDMYDRAAEVEVELHFDEAGEAYASTFDVTPFSHDEVESGVRNEWPTVTANVGFGTMSEDGLRLVIDHVKGVDHRLRCHGGVG